MVRVNRMSRKGSLLEGSFIGSATYSRKCSKNNDHGYGGTCYYGLEMVLLKSNTVDNSGRWFLHCPLYKVYDCNCVFSHLFYRGNHFEN